MNLHPEVQHASLNQTTSAVIGTFIQTTIVADPGNGQRIRVFGADAIMQQASPAGRCEIMLRVGSTTFIGFLGLTGNAPADHINFGDMGIPITASEALNVRDVASVASFEYRIVVRYVLETV